MVGACLLAESRRKRREIPRRVLLPFSYRNYERLCRGEVLKIGGKENKIRKYVISMKEERSYVCNKEELDY